MFDRLKAWLGIPPSNRNVRDAFRDVPFTEYVFENKRQPDGFGASRYAFETLGLSPSSPIDRAVRVRRQILLPFQGPQVWAGQTVTVAPIPSQHGGIFTGGMLTSSGEVPPLGTYSDVDMGAVARNDASAGANDVSASFGLNNPQGGF